MALISLQFADFSPWRISSNKSSYISTAVSYLYSGNTHLGWHRFVISMNWKFMKQMQPKFRFCFIKKAYRRTLLKWLCRRLSNATVLLRDFLNIFAKTESKSLKLQLASRWNRKLCSLTFALMMCQTFADMGIIELILM